MSSALKKWGQIDSRIKFFIATGDVTGYTLTIALTDHVTDASENAVFTSATTIVGAGKLLKDLGRMITVYADATTGNPHTAIYRQVQEVNGALSGGVGGSGANGFKSYWIKVWSASGTGNAPVARTG
jgi:hypothetical protein